MKRRTFISACANATAFIGTMLKIGYAAPIHFIHVGDRLFLTFRNTENNVAFQ